MCGPNATEEEGGENETEGGGENETAVEEGAWDSLGDFLCSNNSDSGRLCGEIFVSEGEILEEGEINDTSCSSTTGNAVKTMGCCMEGYIRRAKAMGELPQDMALSLSAVVEKCGNPTKCSAPTTTSASIRASTTAASIRASTAAASIPTSTTAASIPTSTTAASIPTSTTASIPTSTTAASIPTSTTAASNQTSTIASIPTSTTAASNQTSTIASMKTSKAGFSTSTITLVSATVAGIVAFATDV
jgi:hypothetical protein